MLNDFCKFPQMNEINEFIGGRSNFSFFQPGIAQKFYIVECLSAMIHYEMIAFAAT